MSEQDLQPWHATTILTVRKGPKVVIAGDGQVSHGDTVIKANACKVRRVGSGGVIAGFAHFLFFLIIGRTGPVFFSQVGYIVTGTGVLWGMLIFGERHHPLVWAALAVVVGGVALVQPRRRPRPPGAEEP